MVKLYLLALFRRAARKALAADSDPARMGWPGSRRSTRTPAETARVPDMPAAEFINPLADARAMAAFDDVCWRFALILEGISRNRSMTREQRAAAIQMARRQQKAEAAEARQKVLDDEQAHAEARRRVWQAQHSKPRGPGPGG